MPIKTTKFAGNLPGVTIIVDGDPQNSGLGPYVAWSSVTDTGERLITAPTAAAARQALGLGAAGSSLINGQIATTDEAYDAQSGDGLIIANSDTAAFDITVDRTLVNGDGNPAVFFVMKAGVLPKPIRIVDDTGAVKLAMISGAALALVAVVDGVVYANGVT